MIYYNIPGLYYRKKITIEFIKIIKNFPEVINPNHSIGAIYDSIPYCIWNGGRVFQTQPQASKKEILEIKKIFNEDFNFPIRLIFTNAYLEEKHLYDTFCNLVLDLLDDPKNEVVVASDLLENYIRTTHPNYKIISSTTKCLKDWDSFKTELDKNYYQVCLDYNLNHYLSELQELTINEKNKCEFLINAICPPNCQYRKRHYELNAKGLMSYQSTFNVECLIKPGINTLNSYKNTLTPSEIDNIYYPMGFSHFKIEGRTLTDTEVLANYLNYLIKPEEQLKVLSKINCLK